MSSSGTPHEHEHEFEAEYGLPEPLPAGERLLWQGSPRFLRVFVDIFHARALILWFGVIVAVRLGEQWTDGESVSDMLGTLVGLVPVFALSVGLFAFIAWLVARTSVYTLTDRRIVMRIGIVLSLTFNIPLSRVIAADVRVARDGGGDIALRLSSDDKIAYLNLWPHARPWGWSQPQPMLRGLAQVGPVSHLLRDAWQARRDAPVVAGTERLGPTNEPRGLGEPHPRMSPGRS